MKGKYVFKWVIVYFVCLCVCVLFLVNCKGEKKCRYVSCVRLCTCMSKWKCICNLESCLGEITLRHGRKVATCTKLHHSFWCPLSLSHTHTHTQADTHTHTHTHTGRHTHARTHTRTHTHTHTNFLILKTLTLYIWEVVSLCFILHLYHSLTHPGQLYTSFDLTYIHLNKIRSWQPIQNFSHSRYFNT